MTAPILNKAVTDTQNFKKHDKHGHKEIIELFEVCQKSFILHVTSHSVLSIQEYNIGYW